MGGVYEGGEMRIKSDSSGIGFIGLLTILFIGLKLGGVIGWSWPWVLSPLWIGAAAVLAIVLVVLAVSFIVAVLERIL